MVHLWASLILVLYLFLCVCLQFTKDVVAQLDSVKIDLRGIILLEAEGKQNLLDFSEAGLLEINYADYLEEVTHIFSHTYRNKISRPVRINNCKLDTKNVHE